MWTFNDVPEKNPCKDPEGSLLRKMRKLETRIDGPQYTLLQEDKNSLPVCFSLFCPLFKSIKDFKYLKHLKHLKQLKDLKHLKYQNY